MAREEWHGHVTALSVAPEFRRLGLAAKLMEMLEEISERFVSGLGGKLCEPIPHILKISLFFDVFDFDPVVGKADSSWICSYECPTRWQ